MNCAGEDNIFLLNNIHSSFSRNEKQQADYLDSFRRTVDTLKILSNLDIFIFYQLYLIEKGLILQCLAMPLRVRVGNLLLEITSCEVILS